MQFLIVAYDGTDPKALERRMAARDAHLEGARRMKAEGSFIEGGAILNDSGSMIGSMMLVEFESDSDMRQWLDNDPYIKGGVWEKIDVRPFRRAPL
jgi:uncharacterized protein YciI